LTADVAFDGGDLDCGNGLLLLIRKHIDPLPRGGLLEIRSTEISVDEDLPAWCRMTKNELVSWTKEGKQRSFLVCKGALAERAASVPAQPRAAAVASADAAPRPRREPVAAPVVPPLAVTGMGSWPRPRWLVEAMHAHVQGRLDETAFQETADDAVRLIASAQQRAGATMYTDGEQRRDSYASFVATRLDNCQLVPLIDLLPLVEDPAAFEAELRALDVPAGEVRHPGVFGRIRRSRPIAVHEFDFLRTLTAAPIKVALPGPYLLTRTMWMDCIADSVYATREQIAADIVRVLREEVADLLDAGVAIVQLDEPVLSEVVFSGPKNKRSFMCGALVRIRRAGARTGLRARAGQRGGRRPAARAHRAARVPRQLDARRIGGAGRQLRAADPDAGRHARRRLPAGSLHAPRRRHGTAAAAAGRCPHRRGRGQPEDPVHRAGGGDRRAHRTRRVAVRRRTPAAAPRLRLRDLCRQPDLLDAGRRGQAGGHRAGGAAGRAALTAGRRLRVAAAPPARSSRWQRPARG
jgi:TusA-related sulfurtransferase